MYEIFIDIPNYEGLYQASNLGRIRNIKGRIMKQNEDKDGYMIITLHKDGKAKTHRVHRLVLEAFKANTEGKPEVNHRNEVKSDNRLNNLEWVTSKQNANHATRNARITATNKANGIYKKLAEKNSIPVYCITNNKVYESAREAARILNLDNASIMRCCQGKYKQTKGYKFEYYNEKGDE